MKILFLGDVVARSGCEAVIRSINSIQQAYSIDFTVINAENAAYGKGITKKLYQQLIEAGADVITLGNHAFSKKEIIPEFKNCPFLVRPANMDPLEVGNSLVIRERKEKKIAVINLLGNVFMRVSTDDPIKVMEEMIRDIDAEIILVDLHGEATSEKILFTQYFADRLTAVIGTHTHVQTADERIISGCAFITDVGMCGPYHSILGRDIDEMISHSIDYEQTTYKPADGPSVICGVVVETDDTTNRAVAIERIQIRPQSD